VPAGPEWYHEITFDGYRLRLERDGDRAGLITKGGYDWTRQYPPIAEAALKNRKRRFVIDGEPIVRGIDGYSDFDALHSGKHDDEVELIAFDILALGDDLRKLQLSMRKTNLARLLTRLPDGISLSDFEQEGSVPISSTAPAPWASKASSRSAPIGPTAADDRRTGSR
jgi:bifunctional non-homologous end joining protein LigD